MPRKVADWERPNDLCACGRTKPVACYCCEPCFRKGHAFNELQLYGVQGNHREGVVVVWDPTGDFRPGAKFTGEEFGFAGGPRSRKTTMDMGFWPEGLVIRRGGRFYAVLGGKAVGVEG